MAKQRVLKVTDLGVDTLMPKLRYALQLECGHTVLRATNVWCANNKYSPGGRGGRGRLALCRGCRFVPPR